MRAPNSVTDRELLELILGYAAPQEDLQFLTSNMMEHFGGLREILDCPSVELLRVDGVGERMAVLMRLVRETVYRYSEPHLAGKNILVESTHLEQYLVSRFRGLKDENVLLVFLNDQGVVLGEEMSGAGSVDQVILVPRQVMSSALKHNASSVVLAHNHPHGPPIPSQRDREEAERLREILMPFDVKTLDSIVVGPNRCFSIFKNRPL
ncbi:MAG TPA: JAB domain-containing protein [Desulfomonilaceae bacterium]|nr:JAB domain-containing protein [Desulfomonilaceae bacterium]